MLEPATTRRGKRGWAQGAAWGRLERKLGVGVIETVSIVSYPDYKQQGGLKVLKAVGPDFSKLDQGARILVVDGLVDTGAAAIYGKPLGRPAVDTFITDASKDTWSALSRDMGLAFQPPVVLASSAAVAGPVTSEDLVAANAKEAGHADDGHGGVYFPDGVCQSGEKIRMRGSASLGAAVASPLNPSLCPA
jgi:hypothetical protein